MNKNLSSVIGAIGANIFFSVLPIYAQPFIYVGSHNPPTPPEPGEEYSWLRKWCLWDGENMVLNIWNVAHA